MVEGIKTIRKAKRKFIRSDAHKKVRVGTKWRRPKGRQNKLKYERRGHGKCVKVGYGSKKSLSGLHKNGLKVIAVKTVSDIENIDNKNEMIIIPGTIGQKKKVEMIKKAKEKGIQIYNVKDADKYLKDVEERINKKKEAKVKEEKEKQKKKAKKKEEKKEGTEESLADKIEDEKEKKEEIKKVKDKALTKRDSGY